MKKKKGLDLTSKSCKIVSKIIPHDCVKIVRIQSYSGPHFQAFGLMIPVNIFSESLHTFKFLCS